MPGLIERDRLDGADGGGGWDTNVGGYDFGAGENEFNQNGDDGSYNWDAAEKQMREPSNGASAAGGEPEPNALDGAGVQNKENNAGAGPTAAAGALPGEANALKPPVSPGATPDAAPGAGAPTGASAGAVIGSTPVGRLAKVAQVAGSRQGKAGIGG